MFLVNKLTNKFLNTKSGVMLENYKKYEINNEDIILPLATIDYVLSMLERMNLIVTVVPHYTFHPEKKYFKYEYWWTFRIMALNEEGLLTEYCSIKKYCTREYALTAGIEDLLNNLIKK